MSAYGLGGKPSLLLIDRQGQLRHNYFGIVADLAVGAQIMQLVGEDAVTNGLRASQASEDSAGCNDDGSEINQERD
jgi:hypothetical protein